MVNENSSEEMSSSSTSSGIETDDELKASIRSPYQIGRKNSITATEDTIDRNNTQYSEMDENVQGILKMGTILSKQATYKEQQDKN